MNYDAHFMQMSIALAIKAEAKGEVPVGAIVVQDNQIIAEGWNQTISHSDPTAHAEIVALRAAAKYIGNYRLVDCTLYVTLEPCIMCVGAMVHARIQKLVFGAFDPKTGAAGSALNLLTAKHINHHIETEGGVLQEQCGAVLTEFFQKKRSGQ